MKLSKILMSLCALVWISTSNAGVVTCGSSQRTASLDFATACVTGLKNPKVLDINTNFTSKTGWNNEGELTNNGSNLFLSANLTSGSWGSSSIAGLWSIAPDFFKIYGQAVISMHVGNGGGDPDYFAWQVADGSTMGSWSYERLQGSGGGLSNLKLWGADLAKPTVSLSAANIPEPSTIMLLVLGLFGIIGIKRTILR